ncbi:methyltransferase domain-containing protein [Candidatus Bathyarchaeota archaeon]|nr:methyltransferase domain-containing protein [Candidatus Bathyarchaeota archaeon]
MMYERLARFLIENLDFENVSTILEAGCGTGQLTIPFVRKVMRIKSTFKVIALDLSTGPYKGHLDVLKTRLRRERLKGLITPVNADVRDMHVIADESVDLIVSNETLCELDRNGLEKAIREFYRVLKSGGQMVHGELIQAFENNAQRLVIEANLHSLETSLPKPEWVSPFSDEVAALLHKTGFRDLTVKYFETNLSFRSFSVAMRKLKQWHVDPKFVKEHLQDIKKYGLEYPMEHLIFCRK